MQSAGSSNINPAVLQTELFKISAISIDITNITYRREVKEFNGISVTNYR
jgi:hypothetical protein